MNGPSVLDVEDFAVLYLGIFLLPEFDVLLVLRPHCSTALALHRRRH